jgi:hypothetical protein
MTMRVSRFLLGTTGLLSAAGAAVHAAAFGKALPVIANSQMPAFYSGSFKALWLADSAMMTILAFASIFLSIRVRQATRLMLFLLALFPLATALLIYAFLGGFPAGHILMAIAALLIFASISIPAENLQVP